MLFSPIWRVSEDRKLSSHIVHVYTHKCMHTTNTNDNGLCLCCTMQFAWLLLQIFYAFVVFLLFFLCCYCLCNTNNTHIDLVNRPFWLLNNHLADQRSEKRVQREKSEYFCQEKQSEHIKQEKSVFLVRPWMNRKFLTLFSMAIEHTHIRHRQRGTTITHCWTFAFSGANSKIVCIWWKPMSVYVHFVKLCYARLSLHTQKFNRFAFFPPRNF